MSYVKKKYRDKFYFPTLNDWIIKFEKEHPELIGQIKINSKKDGNIKRSNNSK
jgi:hypothetical protein